jgi:hypothetical protein
MGRTIAGIFVGLVVMLAVTFVGLAGLWTALGAEGAFEPGTWMTSTRWNAFGAVASFAAALAGGFACTRIARGGSAAKFLAVIVLVLGLGPLAQAMKSVGSVAPERPAGTDMVAALENARMPLWNAILNPLIGVVGIVIGGRKKPKRA